jgi:hypothetical protein
MLLAFFVGFSMGCAATNTGNPAMDNGPAAPAGIALLKSPLKRDTMPELSNADREEFGNSGQEFAFRLYG